MRSEEKQREYDEKTEQIHKTYSKIRLKIRLIWLGYNIVTDAAVYFLVFNWYYPLAIAIFIFNFLASFAVRQSRIKLWYRAEERQKDIVREQIPLGGFKFDE